MVPVDIQFVNRLLLIESALHSFILLEALRFRISCPLQSVTDPFKYGDTAVWYNRGNVLFLFKCNFCAL